MSATTWSAVGSGCPASGDDRHRVVGDATTCSCCGGDAVSDDDDVLVAWYREHDAAAAAEGWSLFDTCGADGHDEVEVERIDDAGLLDSDDDALAILAQGVREQRPHAVAALAVLTALDCRRDLATVRRLLRATTCEAKGCEAAAVTTFMGWHLCERCERAAAVMS